MVIGDHFGGGDHFDGGDHFGGGTNLPETCYRFLLPLPAGYIFCSFFYGVGNLQDVVFAPCLGMGLAKPVYQTFYMIPKHCSTGPGCYVL